MKRWLLFMLCVIAICTIIGYECYDFYTPPTERRAYEVKRHDDDTLRIAYYGDSWASMHEEHNCIIAQMITKRTNLPVKVTTHGLSGRTSKDLYEYLFDYQETHNFMMQGYDICFISAGINDTNMKISTSYYKKSMDCIIRFLLFNHIRPIILEIPDYDIRKIYDEQKLHRKIRCHISMLVNDMPIDCKRIFRDALDELIQDKGYEDKVSIIHCKSWNKEFEKDLRELYNDDHLHLNGKGYAVLDSMIASEILYYISSREIINKK